LERGIEVGVFAHAVAVAANVHQMEVMQNAVDQRSSQDVVAQQDLASLLETLVRGQVLSTRARAGVRHPRVFLGRVFKASATAASSILP